MKKFSLVTALSLALPFVVSAQTSITNLDGIIAFVTKILNAVLPLIIAAAVVYFVWGMFQVFLADDEAKKDKAKSTVIYGIIAIFVMVSVWGLVNILVRTFNLQGSAATLVPTSGSQFPTIPSVN